MEQDSAVRVEPGLMGTVISWIRSAGILTGMLLRHILPNTQNTNRKSIMLNFSAQEQTYLKQILQNSPDGIFTIDFELYIRYVNPAFCRMLNYTEQELVGSSIAEYLGDLDILGVCMKSVEETGRCDHQETIFKRRDGTMVHISKNVQAIQDETGVVKDILITIRDMSRLHYLNKELEHSKQQLEQYADDLEHAVVEREQANRELQTTLANLRAAQEQLIEAEKMASLGSLVAGIAHEINTPVGVGVTAASTLQEEVREVRKRFASGELKRSELERFMDHADQAGSILMQNLTQAANLISSFKQVAVDQASEEHRVIHLNRYCHDVIISLKPKFKNRAISIVNECHASIELNTPPGAIYQILSNLLLNSLLHAYDADQAGMIKIAAYQDAGNIVLEYQDDGKGIDPAHIKRIFDPFFTTRRGSGGSGLGLSVVYNLVTTTLKGTISAQSTVGQGACFKILIPN